MIELTVRQEAEKRGLKTAYQLGIAEKIPQTLASRLWKGKPLPRLESLNILCDSWQVDLSALVRWVPNGHTSSLTPKKRAGRKAKAARSRQSKRAR